MLSGMSPKWTAIEAAYHLGEAWVAQQGEDADHSPVETQAIARVMDADPEYFEEVWDVWQEELLLAAYTQKQIDEARYWLEVVVIDELSKL